MSLVLKYQRLNRKSALVKLQTHKPKGRLGNPSDRSLATWKQRGSKVCSCICKCQCLQHIHQHHRTIITTFPECSPCICVYAAYMCVCCECNYVLLVRDDLWHRAFIITGCNICGSKTGQRLQHLLYKSVCKHSFKQSIQMCK